MLRSSVLFLALGCVIFAAFLGLRRLSFATDVLEILPDNIPEVESFQIFREYFDDDHRVILLLKHDEEVFEEDAADFAALLREELPEARIQYRPRFEDEPEVLATTIARIWADSDPGMVRDFASKLLQPESVDEILNQRKDQIALSLDQNRSTMAAYDPLGFLNHPTMAEMEGNGFNFQSEDGRLWLIVIANPDLGIDYRAHAAWVGEIREAASRHLPEGFEYRLTGGPVFSTEVGAGMEKDMAGSITMTLLIVGALFLLTQRSLAQLAVLGVILGLTFLFTLGLAGWVFGTLNLVSVGFAAILLGLVIDYGVVIAREAQPEQSAVSIRRELAPGILWAALTTAVVFGVLMLSTFRGVQQLGAIVLMGLLVGAVVCLWIMPWALQKIPRKVPSKLLTAPFPAVGKSSLILLALALGSASLFVMRGLPDIDFDVAMVEPHESEAAATLETLQELFPAWSKKNLSLVAGGENLDDLRQALAQTQEEIEKLKESGVIRSAEWPVGLLPNAEARVQNRQLWEKVAAEKESLLDSMKSAGFSEKGRQLNAMVLEKLGQQVDGLDAVTRMFYHPAGFFAGRVQLNEKPDEFNTAKVKVLNREGVTVSGWGVLRLILLNRVRGDLYFLFLPATAVLLGALILVFRSWKDALMTAGILLTVLLLVNAMAVLINYPWNFLSSMAIPLIVGTGIDYSIHLIFALRRSNGDLSRVWNGVGKGIFFCGLSTVVGFGSLIFASNETLKSMGLFCSVGVCLTMLLSLLVVPSFWKAVHQQGQEPEDELPA